MRNATATTPARTVGIAQPVLALAVALVLGTMVVPVVEASKKGKNTIASIDKRVGAQRDYCELLGGGTLEVRTLPSGTKNTYCKGGMEGGKRCVHNERETTCKQTVTPPGSEPAAPPIGGSNRDPGDGPNAGAAAPPQGSGEADPNGEAPGQPILQ